MDIPNQESFEHFRTMATSHTPRTLAEMPTPPAEGDDRQQGMSSNAKIRGFVGLDTWVVGPRYQIVRVLGRGSYGEVVEAIDKRYVNVFLSFLRSGDLATLLTTHHICATLYRIGTIINAWPSNACKTSSRNPQTPNVSLGRCTF